MDELVVVVTLLWSHRLSVKGTTSEVKASPKLGTNYVKDSYQFHSQTNDPDGKGQCKNTLPGSMGYDKQKKEKADWGWLVRRLRHWGREASGGASAGGAPPPSWGVIERPRIVGPAPPGPPHTRCAPSCQLCVHLQPAVRLYCLSARMPTTSSSPLAGRANVSRYWNVGPWWQNLVNAATKTTKNLTLRSYGSSWKAN